VVASRRGFVSDQALQNSCIAKLHKELKDVRQPYLSTAQPRKTRVRRGQEQQRYLNDREREEIDASAKTMLRELNASIRRMEEVEQLRREIDEALIRKKFIGPLGALHTWAAGGASESSSKSPEHAAAEARARDIGLHRDSVILYLRQKLQLCGRTQQEMMEARFEREMARAEASAMPDLPALPASPKSMHSPRSPTHPIHQQNRSDGDEEETYYKGHNMDLTPEQLQMFEKNNQDMMKHYETTLDKVRYVAILGKIARDRLLTT
jgi:syntaxin 18